MNYLIIKYKKTMIIINKIMSVFSGFLLLALTLLLIINILFREIGHPVPGLSSISVILMIIVIYLGLSRSEEYEEHANIDILATVLSTKYKRYNYLIINIINLFTIMIFFIISIPEVKNSYLSHESFGNVISVPVWPAKIAICVGLGLYLLQIILKIIEPIILKNEKD